VTINLKIGVGSFGPLTRSWIRSKACGYVISLPFHQGFKRKSYRWRLKSVLGFQHGFRRP